MSLIFPYYKFYSSSSSSLKRNSLRASSELLLHVFGLSSTLVSRAVDGREERLSSYKVLDY